MDNITAISQIKEKYDIISPLLNERSRRIWAATEAKALGHGGQVIVSKATGIHKNTVLSGVRELKNGCCDKFSDRIRNIGGGRKSNIQKDKSLRGDIKNIVESSTRGDPESPLLWTSKSTRKIADHLNKNIHRASHELVAKTLSKDGL